MKVQLSVKAYEVVEIQLLLLTWAPDGVSGEVRALAALPPEKKSPVSGE